jgi:hypothetical protein
MVIIRTSATEVSIQAVSPELGAQAVKVLASQAGGNGAAASCAKEGLTKSSAAKIATKMPQARIVKLLCVDLFGIIV